MVLPIPLPGGLPTVIPWIPPAFPPGALRADLPVRSPGGSPATPPVLPAGLHAFTALGVADARAASQAFFRTWNDGKGEVDVYALREERYGEVREGHAILIYVSEELDRNTYLKVESDRIPQDQRMYVIKLNSLRRFPTGIYDYAVMTTVFSVADSHLGHPRFQAARVTNTVQEWCGQVFQRMDLRRDGWHFLLHSYFEAEGDQELVLPAKGTDLEDNLWVKIRELDGEWLAPGSSIELSLIPAMWEDRKTHDPPEAHPARLTKGEVVDFETPLGTFRAFPWSWSLPGRTVLVWIEARGAHRVLGWQDNRGGSGRLASSERTAYWKHNGNDASDRRAALGLPPETLEP